MPAMPTKTLILFFKAIKTRSADQGGLFDAPVTVQAHTTQAGTFIAPYASRRRKRLAPASSGDLFGMQHSAVDSGQGGSGNGRDSNSDRHGGQPPSPIPSYASSEIQADKNNAHAYRVAAQAIAQPRYANKPPIPVTVQATNEEIQVGWSGIKHVLRDGKPSWQESLATLHVEELLQGAKKTKIEPDRLGRKDPIAIHRYQTAAYFDDHLHQITIVVREHSDGKRYYDHSIVETKTPAGLPVSSAEKTAHEPAPPFAGAENTIPPPVPESKPKPADSGTVTLTAYRKRSSPATGSIGAGTFYFLNPENHYDPSELVAHKMEFSADKLLRIDQKQVEPFVGLPAEYLAGQWFPNMDWDQKAEELGLREDESGAAMDILVAQEAQRRGYDAIAYGNTELQVLKQPEPTKADKPKAPKATKPKPAPEPAKPAAPQISLRQDGGKWIASAPDGSLLYTSASKEQASLRGEQELNYWIERNRYESQPLITGYRGDMEGVGGSFGATEGNGVYIAKGKSMASFFSVRGKVNKIYYRQPLNPLIVNEEPLPLLQEPPEMMEPISPTDSAWMKLNKQAILNTGTTNENYGRNHNKIVAELTSLMLEAGYDAVDVTSAGDSWVVLLDQNLIESSKKASDLKTAKKKTRLRKALLVFNRPLQIAA